MSASIVTTTIHKPVLLAGYCENARNYDHDDVNFIVVGDKKTPLAVSDYCEKLVQKYGYDVQYYDVEKQNNYLGRFPQLANHLPFNSVQRRNIGLLLAYENDADVIITIDDDNFVTDQDFVGGHLVVGTNQELVSVSSDSGWFNVCEMLTEQENRPFYHRGFPMGQRWQKTSITRGHRIARVVVNAGLWLNDPDIDAVTRMDMPIRALGVRPEYDGGLMLDVGTWSPFNSQNTALAREAIPAYFLSPYVGRYDDVWASYFLRKIIDHLGDAVQYGGPLVRQDRNSHNLWQDLDSERNGMELTDRLIGLLREIPLSSRSYQACYQELTERLADAFSKSGLFDRNELDLLNQPVEGMKIWADVFSSLHN